MKLNINELNQINKTCLKVKDMEKGDVFRLKNGEVQYIKSERGYVSLRSGSFFPLDMESKVVKSETGYVSLISGSFFPLDMESKVVKLETVLTIRRICEE